MTPDQFDKLATDARQDCRTKLTETKEQYGLGAYASWNVDLERGEIQFLDTNRIERVSAKIQVAGSWSSGSESWMWGWGNDSIPDVSRSRMEEVRAFGEKEQIPILTTALVPCDELQAWVLFSVAGKMLKAEGFYRGPGKSSDSFLLLFSITKTP
jgi:hypothetical protein